MPTANWSVEGALSVGEDGTEILNFQDGGLLTSSSGLIGSAAGSSGAVTVDGQKFRLGHARGQHRPALADEMNRPK